MSCSSTSTIFRLFSSTQHSFNEYHHKGRWFSGNVRTIISLPVTHSTSTVAFSRKKKNSSVSTLSGKKNKKLLNDNDDDVNIDEDAFEALFNQLEEDLKNDGLSFDDEEEEITEEDLNKLEKELAEALGDEEYDVFPCSDEIESDDEEEEEPQLKLKNWQLRRLASALKIGRRKTNIKSLSAELGLDRAVVLELLRDPPPNLVLMSAALPDEVIQKSAAPDTEKMETSLVDKEESVITTETEATLPVHVRQNKWSVKKRLKKVHVATLEKVYSRSKRPTNSMISNIIQLTNLPRKTVIKWFEEKRHEDMVPDHHQPFQRAQQETTSIS